MVGMAKSKLTICNRWKRHKEESTTMEILLKHSQQRFRASSKEWYLLTTYTGLKYLAFNLLLCYHLSFILDKMFRPHLTEEANLGGKATLKQLQIFCKIFCTLRNSSMHNLLCIVNTAHACSVPFKYHFCCIVEAPTIVYENTICVKRIIYWTYSDFLPMALNFIF